MVDETVKENLGYCQKMLDVLEKIEKNEQECREVQQRFEKIFIRTRKINFLSIEALVLLIFAGLGVFLDFPLLTLVLLVLGILLVEGLIAWLTFRRLRKIDILEQLRKKQQALLQNETKKLESKRKVLEKQLEMFERVPIRFRTILAVQHLIRYFNRGETQSLEEALYFLEMDENYKKAVK